MDHSKGYSGSAFIVVGVDGSENSDHAFEVALGLAQQRSQALRVVAAYTEPGYEYLPENTQGIAQENAQAVINDLVATVHDVDVAISSATVEGDAAAVLTAESRDASLVVVGKRGRSRFAGRFLGSVSAAVAAHSHCPSLVVPARGQTEDMPEAAFAGLPKDIDDTDIGTIASDDAPEKTDFRDSVVVGVDLDVQPVEVALHAAKYAEERQLNLILVNAHHFSGSAWIPVSPIYMAEIPDLRKNVAQRLARIAEEVGQQTTAPVQWRYFDASPADLLTEASSTASMVVVGTRGRGGFTGLLLGSVSQAVLNRAVCPVLVIPVEPED